MRVPLVTGDVIQGRNYPKGATTELTEEDFARFSQYLQKLFDDPSLRARYESFMKAVMNGEVPLEPTHDWPK